MKPDRRDLDQEFAWLITATNKGDSRLAWLGFTNVWVSPYYDAEYNAVRIFSITDRVGLSPDNKVQFKFWRGTPSTTSPILPTSPNTRRRSRSTTLGEDLQPKRVRNRLHGGLVGEYTLPKDAPLGVYSINVQIQEKGQVIVAERNTFRVEEYKKPEFEVTIEAPKET